MSTLTRLKVTLDACVCVDIDDSFLKSWNSALVLHLGLGVVQLNWIFSPGITAACLEVRESVGICSSPAKYICIYLEMFKNNEIHQSLCHFCC